jgi:uncharacterized protein YndB with AHSA1/START domain
MRIMKQAPGIAIAIGSLTASPVPAHADRVLRAELLLGAPVAEVWDAWTTEKGIASFFAPVGRVDLRVDGTYDVWFFPDAEPGGRGAEGMRILDVEPMRRFAFTWDAPPSNPKIRGKRTLVVIDFSPEGSAATRLRFTHLGWGDGPEWDQAYDYFDRAWGAHVLPRLVHRFDAGPIDWDSIPELAPVAATLKQELTARPS